ncbi:MAG: EAL domain-containing protein [Rubrivivax sp.]|nr:MAG: EAL domain-containing protein [Rubrivivax sp.]
MVAGASHLEDVVSRVALLVAVAVALALPAGYAFVVHRDFSEQLQFKARVKATALSNVITAAPDTWQFAENRLQGLLAREPVPLETEQVLVFDEHGELLTTVGATPATPVLRRSQALFDATRIAGRIDVTDSLRPLIRGSLRAALAGLALGLLVFYALRTLPLRALRRTTKALFAQTQRAEVTLHSIGDAVITTDELTRIEFMNPVAERLSGWSLDKARTRTLAEVLRLVDAHSRQPVASAMPLALAEGRIVSFGREIDLIRRDGECLSIDDSAAPIRDPDGRITGGVLVFRDVGASRSLARQRAWEATHDSLTGLANRREFEHLVGMAVKSAGDQGRQHVVCYLDMDQFKVVNDTCGHAAGDELLKRFAAQLRAGIRESDTLARLGGDEFGLLLEGCSVDRAEIICADLLAAVSDFRFHWESKVFNVGVSIGIAAVASDASAAEALGAADTACYWAKAQGRGRCCVYRRGDLDLESRRQEVGWVARINAALSENRFVLYGQPYLGLTPAAEGAAHLEALLRMVDEQGRLIQPGSFLPAAERFNLMPAIDRWVIRTVFSHYGELLAARGGGRFTCAINLSATSLNSPGLLDFVSQQFALHSLPEGAICFEITETSAINNLRHAADFMRACQALGIRFALDDFGTGMSSFGYLKHLPVDYLKIDGGFIRKICQDDVDLAMTESINRIGHLMGMRTVAEYAESDAIVQALRRIGVDYAQGYAVARPVPLWPPAAPPAVS